MSDFGDLVARIAAAVASTGVRIPDDGAYPDNINPSVGHPVGLLVQLDDDALSIDESSTTIRFELLVVVQIGGSIRAASASAFPYVSRTGDKSIRLALRTGLGGDLLAVRVRQTGRFDVDGAIVYGPRFEMEVISQ